MIDKNSPSVRDALRELVSVLTKRPPDTVMKAERQLDDVAAALVRAKSALKAAQPVPLNVAAQEPASASPGEDLIDSTPAAATPSPASQEPAGWRLVPLPFIQGVCALAHKYSFTAIPPDYYRGVEGDAFKDAYRRCGRELAKVRAMLTAAPQEPAEPMAHKLLMQIRDALVECSELVGPTVVCDRARRAVQSVDRLTAALSVADAPQEPAEPVALTDEQIERIFLVCGGHWSNNNYNVFARAIEAELRCPTEAHAEGTQSVADAQDDPSKPRPT
jgi:hypothetical protein